MLTRWIVLLACLVALGFLPRPTVAQDSPFTGIDVLFLVDQSGSMGGREFGEESREGTDPNGLRFEAAQFAMDWLGELANVEVSASGAIRMGVIYFGDPQASTILNWETLAPSGGDWSRQRADLYNQLSAATFGRRNFGYTNFEQAFQIGRDMFDRLPALPAGQRNMRVVVVITDGEPCAIRDVDANRNCTNDIANRAQLSRVNDLVQAAFPESDYRTYIVAIETPTETYWDEYRDLWFTILREPNRPPRAARVDTPAEMRTAVSDFLQDIRTLISRTSVTVSCPLNELGECTAYVPPYTRLARIRTFKADIAGLVTNIFVTRPDGVTLTRDSAEITKTGEASTIETWTLEFPAQGSWRIRVDDTVNQVEVEIDQNFASAEFLFRNPPEYYQWQSIPLAPFLYFNVNEGGVPARRPLVLDPAFPITVVASITDPSGVLTEAVIPQDPNPTGSPAPQFRASLVTTTPGDYQVGILGRVDNANDPLTGSPPFIPVDTRTKAGYQTFTVLPATVTVELDPLLQSQGGGWLATDSAEVCVIVSDPSRGGMLIPNLEALRVESTLTRQSDGVTYVFPLSVANDRCSFRGLMAPPEAGEYTIAVRGYLTPTGGAETMVFDELQSLVMRAAPVNYITVQLESPMPAETGQPARSNIVQPAPFFQSEALSIRASAYGSDGAPVDLRVLVGTPLAPEANPLTLMIRDAAGNDVTQDSALTALTPTSYELITNAYGLGSYQIEVQGKPLNLRSCGCAYARDEGGLVIGDKANVIVERVIPIEVAYWAGGILLVVVVAAVGLWATYRYLKAITEAPLSGTLYFYRQVEDVANQTETVDNIGVLALDRFKRNTKTLRSRDIPTTPRLPIRSVELTNYSAQDIRQRGSVRVRVTPETGAARSFTVTPGGGMQRLYEDPHTGDVYYVEKDPDAE